MSKVIHTSKRVPSFILHRYTSKKSWPPAAINSSLASIAKQENCTGRGEVRVRKFLYLAKSYARTVPSNEADATNLRLWLKRTLDIDEVCSWNVSVQNPVNVFHSLTFPSSPPVIIYWPSGLYARQFILVLCPCCFMAYVSLCHSQTRSCPAWEHPIAIQSPVEFNAIDEIRCREIL